MNKLQAFAATESGRAAFKPTIRVTHAQRILYRACNRERLLTATTKAGMKYSANVTALYTLSIVQCKQIQI